MKTTLLLHVHRVGLLSTISAIAIGSTLAAPGDVDPTFGDKGRVLTPVELGAGNDMAMLPDGRFVVVGRIRADAKGNDNFFVARYLADGKLDTTFDGDGTASTPLGTQTSTAAGVAVQPDGKIIAVGQTVSNFNGTTGEVDFGLIRYNVDGTLDGTFGDGGRVITNVDSNDQANAVAVMPNGKIAVVGTVAGGYALAVVVYNADGTLDTGFDGDGKATVSFDNRLSPTHGDAVTVQPDNKILAGGNTNRGFSGTAETDSLLVRFNTDGTRDSTFNNGVGMRIYSVVAAEFDTFTALVMQPDGKILAACAADTDFIVARLNADGTNDSSFGQNGYAACNFYGRDNGTGIALQTDGKIVQAGTSLITGKDADFAVARYTSSGELDAKFSTGTAPLSDGQVTTDFQANSDDYGRRVAIQPSGRIIVFGRVSVAGGGGADIGVVRYRGSPPQLGGRVLNISTRMRVETGDNVLIAGFIITGDAPKKVIVRGLGPSLPVSGPLADPTLDLDGGRMTNDDWRSTQQAEINATGIPPASNLESAIVATLDPGPHTATLRGKNNGTGVGLVEVYDLESGTPVQLANISTRGAVQTGDNVMIGGFIIRGDYPAKLILRALGPSLPVSGTLQDPTLELVDANGATISNDNWRTTQEAEIAAVLPPSDNREAAIIATLVPGSYTAVVRGKANTTGVALVEGYNLQ